jgi:O-acetyl-ADP-ribose deacetylase (regulator of RNase III)
MSITWKRGNLFDDKAEAIAIPVNCVGVMGKGVALECKERHPWVFKRYQAMCHESRVRPGDVVRFVGGSGRLYLVATKDHYRDGSRLEWIDEGLQALQRHIRILRNESIAIPALGCGAGGLAWCDVKSVIEHYLNIEGVDVRVYEPMETK